jgi:hypothetical protein
LSRYLARLCKVRRPDELPPSTPLDQTACPGASRRDPRHDRMSGHDVPSGPRRPARPGVADGIGGLTGLSGLGRPGRPERRPACRPIGIQSIPGHRKGQHGSSRPAMPCIGRFSHQVP